jgi:Spy/CpxP family protein refolding chaperone
MEMVFGSNIVFLHYGHGAADTSSPYSGQETREIKALSRDEINGYLSGDGMGFAKAAELNHYPGPKHVLQLANQLQLSEEQRQRTQRVFDEMNSKAINLGQQLVEKERLMDSRFAAANISDAELLHLVSEISDLQGKIREAHLQAHLAERTVLTADQLVRYDALRGYQATGSHGQHDGHWNFTVSLHDWSDLWHGSRAEHGCFPLKGEI